jgi:DNA invertase Pin-like site-specific DNA recombinase
MLPRNPEQLRGQPTIGFVRVSTDKQDLSPATQRRAIARYAAEHGLRLLRVQELTVSGKDAWRDPAVTAITEEAEAGRIRAVLVARLDRMGRSTRTDLFIDDLTDAGAVLVDIASDQISGNPAHRRTMRSGIATARNESDIISERVTDGIHDRNAENRDQWGTPPPGFTRHRAHDKAPSLLQIDDDTIGAEVALRARYAIGDISIEALARSIGRSPNTLKDQLANRLYNGWVQDRGQWLPARWHDNPPVSDELFARVQAVRAQRRRAGGPHDPQKPNPWRGLFECASCHARLTLDGHGGQRASRYQRLRHQEPCEAWGRHERHPLHWWTDPLVAQITAMDTSEAILTEIITHLNADRPANVTDCRFQRARNETYEAHKARKISGAEADARIAQIDEDEASHRLAPATRVDPVRIREAWEDIRTTWAFADEPSKAAVIRAVYQQVSATANGFESVTLTPEAERIGLTMALPERIVLDEGRLACPRGLEPPTFRSAT